MTFVLLLFALALKCAGGYQSAVPSYDKIQTGFWYGGETPPQTKYESLPYANMTLKINRPIIDGPGQSLITDPVNTAEDLYLGNTIARQTFDTQFVLDMNRALGIEVERVFVMGVRIGDIHFSMEMTNVIVNFVFLERNSTDGMTLLEAIQELNEQVQDPASRIYKAGTNVTYDIDPYYGLEVVGWDMSLKLTYAIEVIGGTSVIDGNYLNQGGFQLCDKNSTALLHTKYCEFERFYEQDVARALKVSIFRVQIFFIKTAAKDAVLVHFRLSPPDASQATKEPTIEEATLDLVAQINDDDSELYKGNVTIRVDSTWGLSGAYARQRKRVARFTRSYYDYDPSRLNNPKRAVEITPYHRCKQNRRCNWGVLDIDQASNNVRYYYQLFDNGQLRPVELWLDFEEWRIGTRGWNWDGLVPHIASNQSTIKSSRAAFEMIRGAHFWPFDEESLGPDVPCYRGERNQGLVLDRQLQAKQINQQDSLVQDIEGKIAFLERNIQNSTMGPVKRSRKDTLELNQKEIEILNQWRTNERKELQELTDSQCARQRCSLLFNTSSLALTGSIAGTGTLRKTKYGTEVAVFTFNSVYLGPEVKVRLVGQRAFSIVSKTQMVINTTFVAEPGTIGGFQGGISVGRFVSESFIDNPRDILMCDLNNPNISSGTYCMDSHEPDRNFTASERASIVSNCASGPGAGCQRVHPFVITTTADDIDEIQVITTSAQKGQTLGGGFRLFFGNYSTAVIPHDVGAVELKDILEENLNNYAPKDSPVAPDRYLDGPAGIGKVTVSRRLTDDQEGFTWKVTFNTAIGNVEQLRFENYLTSLQTTLTIHTERDGNEIEGNFTLTFRSSSKPDAKVQQTVPVGLYETVPGLKKKLLDVPMITTAWVTGLDHTRNCEDGLCPDGPLQSRGMIWSVYVTTDEPDDNITPTSPTAPETKLEGDLTGFISVESNLLAQGAKIEVTYSGHMSTDDMMRELDVSIPFTLAFGGGGGSHGGSGGKGYGENPPGQVYGDRTIPDLVGGSGGSTRAINPLEMYQLLRRSPGRGGHGGGAVEFIASNDIIIGPFGRILMRGGDGEQAAEGGGGGGSGGSILLAAGGVVDMRGELDVSGGAGGFGGPGTAVHYGPDGAARLIEKGLRRERFTLDDMGGGGGGRIAMYGESVVDEGAFEVAGGPCGIDKHRSNLTVVNLNSTFTLELQVPLENPRLFELGAQLINNTIPGVFLVNYLEASRTLFLWQAATNASNSSSADSQQYQWVQISGASGNMSAEEGSAAITKLVAQVGFHIVLEESKISSAVAIAELTKKLGVVFAEVFITGIEFSEELVETIFPVLGHPTTCSNPGNNGTYYTEAKMTTKMYVRPTGGAERTSNALFLSNREETKTETGSQTEAPFQWNGPTIPFGTTAKPRPTRVTYYTKMVSVPGESQKANFGTLFALLQGTNVESVIGVFVGDKIMQGANFQSAVDEKFFLKRVSTIDEYPTFDRWYKVDIHINWKVMKYYIMLDDVIVIYDQTFKADYVDGIRISLTRAVDVYFDEIYIGFDPTMEFQCPRVERSGVETSMAKESAWNLEQVNGAGSTGFTELNNMQRHYSHLDPTGSVPFDGQGAVKVFSDIKLKTADGDYLSEKGQVRAGSMIYLDDSDRSGKTPSGRSATTTFSNSDNKGLWFRVKDGPGGAGDGRFYVYMDHVHASDIDPSFNGGVASCSSQELGRWRFEGIVFHNTNSTDLVYNSQGPFVLVRPKIMFNPSTQEYVMYSVMNEPAGTLAQAAICTSNFEDGPFFFRRSFYPDGNVTKDQNIFINGGQPVLARTYYATQEYLAPERVMSPVWESVKNKDGTVNFRQSYHRAKYALGYDNFHDIAIQRWRNESTPWEVQCRDGITNEIRPVPPGEFTEDGNICIDPKEYKVVLGQGVSSVQGEDAITSRYISPLSLDNSWWQATSVPSQKSQPWSSNYREGYCGIRPEDDNLDQLDPVLATYEPESRDKCSNIADNRLHPTLQDHLMGTQRVVLRRRTKFMALSELTFDFMDTTGNLIAFEGENTAGYLTSLIAEKGQYGFGAGDSLGSTFRAPRRSNFETALDYKTRFRQFIKKKNDRAQYSLACVIDGECPNSYANAL
jgi:hypothetical protein